MLNPEYMGGSFSLLFVVFTSSLPKEKDNEKGEKEAKMKMKITTATLGLTLMSNIGYSATSAQLTNSMLKYCVPDTSGICGTSSLASYRSSTNSCVCGQGRYYKQRRCYDCGAGTYSSKDDATTCTACSKGHYQNKTGQTGCLSCKGDEYQDKTGQTSCKQCPTKTKKFKNCRTETKNQSISSEICNLFVNAIKGVNEDFGLGVCKALNNSSPEFKCIPEYGEDLVEAGYVSNSDRTSCNICPDGTGKSENGCENCSAGSYSIYGFCKTCPIGTYQNKSKMTFCSTCSSGYCAPSKGSSSCKSCGNGVSRCDAKTCVVKSCKTNYVLKNGKCKFYKKYSTPGEYQITLPKGSYKITVAGAGGGRGGNWGCCSLGHHVAGFMVCGVKKDKCVHTGGKGGAGGRGEGITKRITLNNDNYNYNIVVGKAGSSGADDNGAKNDDGKIVGCGVYGYYCNSIKGSRPNGSTGGQSKFYNITARGGNGGNGGYCGVDGGDIMQGCAPAGRDGSAGSGYSGGASSGSDGWVIVEEL